MPKILTSMFLFFKLMIMSIADPFSSHSYVFTQHPMALFSDLTKNADGSINHLNLINQVFVAVQDNDTYTFQDAMKQPNYRDFFQAMQKEGITGKL